MSVNSSLLLTSCSGEIPISAALPEEPPREMLQAHPHLSRTKTQPRPS